MQTKVSLSIGSKYQTLFLSKNNKTHFIHLFITHRKGSKIKVFSSAILSTFYAVFVNYKSMISSCLKEKRSNSEKTEAYWVNTQLEVP